MNLESLKALSELAGSLSEEKDLTQEQIKSREHALTASFLSLTTAHEFKPGQLVSQKSEVRKYKRPGVGVPAVFIKYLDEKKTGDDPVYVEEDMVIGVFIGDEFMEYTVDSRRFEPWQTVSAVN